MNNIGVYAIDVAILLPLLASPVMWRSRDPKWARTWSIIVASATLALVLVSWFLGGAAGDPTAMPVSVVEVSWTTPLFCTDGFNAPMLTLVALVALLVIATTVRGKMGRFSFGRALLIEALTLAAFASRSPWLLIALLAASAISPWRELRQRRHSSRVFAIHMVLSVMLLAAGQLMVDAEGGRQHISLAAVLLLFGGVCVRAGLLPFQCWLPDLFENAGFGTSLIFATPLTGAYAAARLFLPIAPHWAIQALAILALTTACYAASMAFVQQEVRRYFSYFLLSYGSIVLLGLTMDHTTGLAGALCVWLSAGLAIAGMGMVLRAVEARVGHLSLARFHGLYDQIPMLAVFFLFCGLAIVGFPGTFGFIGHEMLFDGALATGLHVGLALILATAINGICLLHVYFRVFTGGIHRCSVPIARRVSERLAIIGMTVVMLGGGVFPQPFLASRYRAAEQFLTARSDQPVQIQVAKSPLEKMK